MAIHIQAALFLVRANRADLAMSHLRLALADANRAGDKLSAGLILAAISYGRRV